MDAAGETNVTLVGGRYIELLQHVKVGELPPRYRPNKVGYGVRVHKVRGTDLRAPRTWPTSTGNQVLYSCGMSFLNTSLSGPRPKTTQPHIVPRTSHLAPHPHHHIFYRRAG